MTMSDAVVFARTKLLARTQFLSEHSIRPLPTRPIFIQICGGGIFLQKHRFLSKFLNSALSHFRKISQFLSKHGIRDLSVLSGVL